jgi:hypothetical protein
LDASIVAVQKVLLNENINIKGENWNLQSCRHFVVIVVVVTLSLLLQRRSKETKKQKVKMVQ